MIRRLIGGRDSNSYTTMIEKISRNGRGIVLWIRSAPGRVLSGLSARTRLPEGFWVVLSVSAIVGALAACVAVSVLYRTMNSPTGKPIPVESEHE